MRGSRGATLRALRDWCADLPSVPYLPNYVIPYNVSCFVSQDIGCLVSLCLSLSLPGPNRIPRDKCQERVLSTLPTPVSITVLLKKKKIRGLTGRAMDTHTLQDRAKSFDEKRVL